MKEIKRAHHFVLMMTPSLCSVLLFWYFPAINIKLSLFISRDLSPEICLVFHASISCAKLKLFSLFHFNEIYFLEWSIYLFNNTYIVRSSLVVIYPGR